MNNFKKILFIFATLLSPQFIFSAEVHGELVRALADPSANMSAIEKILARGANINFEDEVPLLTVAIMCKKPAPIIGLFIQKGADVNKESKNNTSPLMAAAHVGDMDIVKILVEAGANINYRVPSNGLSALMVAADRKPAIVEYLLSKNANPSLEEIHRALKIAKERFNQECIALLQQALAKQLTHGLSKLS